jgi:spermidine/putrescine transport system permease protein
MSRGKRLLAPYFLILPGGVWLLLFFIVPMITMLSLSLQQGDVVSGYVFTGHWQTYVDAIVDYKTQLIRSLIYGAVATILLIVVAFPVAYWIAFYAGRRKATFLFLLLLPFFVSFVLRTISWRQILTDEGFLLGPLKDAGLLSASFHILGTPAAVIGGLVYNFLPFMVLPVYVALERIDPRVVEAARDLYATPVTAFRKVILPLALPGVFAGVLMTFVPASSDYVNSAVLGSSSTTMIGQVIQAQYLTSSNYPTASALSFLLMAVLLIGVFAYARALGTEDVMKVAAR